MVLANPCLGNWALETSFKQVLTKLGKSRLNVRRAHTSESNKSHVWIEAFNLVAEFHHQRVKQNQGVSSC